MAIKKSELYSSIWASCDELRGGMDASQYKDYVLVLLFVKYVSDKYAGKKDALIDVPRGGRFSDMVALKGDKEIGDKMNKIIAKLAKANELSGVIDVADFNDSDKLGKGKEMVDRLSNLVSIFDNPSLNFSGNRTEGDDLLGDAYEYLMRHFATESGKSKGQFYTPAEVSRIMAKVIGIGNAKSASQTIYDPTCGSGSLLLKVHDEALSRTRLDMTLYGQEMDNATGALAKMNMILHDCPTAEIWKDNTLSSPHFKQANGKLKTFDFAVANPPFSFKSWSNGFDPEHDLYNRFEYGIPPAKNGDYAFLLHILASLKSTGKGAVIMPHGVLFRGGAEGGIRKNSIKQGFIKGIIGLPANLFYGTSIPACIIVLDKENAQARKGIFLIDASKGFIKDGNKNRLRAQDIHRIVDTFTKQAAIDKYSRMAPLAEIEKNDFNLNIPRYIDSTEPEDLQDIEAHLKGGIPNRDIDDLAQYWDVFPSVRAKLFTKADRKGYSRLLVAPADIKATIFNHSEFTTFNQSVTALFTKWKKANTAQLKGIAKGGRPNALVEALSENLLATFSVGSDRSGRLVDPYDVYQHLLNYWAETMQDDVYQLVQEGWKAVLDNKPNIDLIPRTLTVARFFATAAKAIEQFEADRDASMRQMEEMVEEHGGEEGLLEEAKTEKGKLTKVSVKARLVNIKDDKDAADERKLLNDYLSLIEKESDAGKKVKDAQKALDAKVAAQYIKLSEAEIKTLVIDDKWLAWLATDVQSELDRVSQALTGRIKQLAERYATPLSKLTEELAVLSARVDGHLKKMGGASMEQLLTGKKRLPGFSGAWEVRRLGDIFDFSGGFSASRDQLSGEGHCYLHYGDIHKSSKTFIDVRAEYLNIPKLNIPLKRVSSMSLLADGDVVFVDASEDDEGTSKHVVVVNKESIVYIAGLHTIVAKNKNTMLDNTYKRYCFQTRSIKDQFYYYSVGTKVSGISKSNITKITMPVPSLPEQTAIAAVLSDMDAEITALEARRDKTRALKQGMMQELLTGRIRLVGGKA